MTIGRPKSALHLTSDEEAHLKSLVASRSVSHALGTRARIILVSQGGLSNTAIAGRLGLTRAALGQWRQRFIRDRIAGLQDDLRAGRPRTHADERLAALLTKTPQTQPAAQP
ncbi:MAG: IS630 family transposase, partial [Nitrospiraceae bacterium]